MASNAVTSLSFPTADQIKRIIKAIGAAFGSLTGLAFLRYLVFLISYKRSQRRSKLPMPPGPTPLPVLGSLIEAGSIPGPDGNPLVHRALMKLGRSYNGLYGLYLGSQYTIVITSTSVAEETMCDHKLDSGEQGRGANNVDRAPLQSKGGHHAPTMNMFTKDGQGVAMSYGSYWKKMRGRVVAHMTSPIVSEKNAPMIMEEVNSVCWAWRQRVLRGEPLSDMVAQLKRESMNMGFRLLFSERFGAELPQDFRTFQFCVEYFFKNLAAGSPSDMIPALRVLPNPFLKEFKSVIDTRDEIIDRFVTKHRKEFDDLRAQGKMKDKSQARDMCDLFFWDQIDGFDSTDDNGKPIREFLTDEQVRILVFDLVFASTDTTAITNEWAIYHLINNPDIQKKLHEEIDRVVGPDRVPTYEDRDNMPYFWAFVKEVFRWCIVAPLAAFHYSIEDQTLHDDTGKEYFVPAGTQIFLHAYSLARDPAYWDEPEKFNPDRWFNKREEGLDLPGIVKRKPVEHYKFAPFSLGPRMCPGYSFAKVAQFLQMATIIQSFSFKLSADAEKRLPHRIKNGQLDMTENWGLSMSPIRYSDYGVIVAECRPASRLHKPLPNDIDPTKTFLEGRVEKKVKLLVREQLSHDTALLRFGLGDPNRILGLPLGKHIKVHLPNVVGTVPGKWNNRDDPEAGQSVVTRAYTPTSSDKDIGYVDLLVKIYQPKTVAAFPDGGKVSHQLGKIALGDEITISGPWGLVEYLGRSKIKVGRNIVTKRFVGMMAGGSGITPMLQILRAALEDREDATKFSLIYANQTENDILCRATLEDLEQRFPSRFRLHYTVDRAPQGGNWKYSVGFIDAPMITEHMPPKGDDTVIFACGPPPMIEFACKKNLEKLGYSKEQFVAF